MPPLFHRQPRKHYLFLGLPCWLLILVVHKRYLLVLSFGRLTRFCNHWWASILCFSVGFGLRVEIWGHCGHLASFSRGIWLTDLLGVGVIQGRLREVQKVVILLGKRNISMYARSCMFFHEHFVFDPILPRTTLTHVSHEDSHTTTWVMTVPLLARKLAKCSPIDSSADTHCLHVFEAGVEFSEYVHDISVV